MAVTKDVALVFGNPKQLELRTYDYLIQSYEFLKGGLFDYERWEPGVLQYFDFHTKPVRDIKNYL